MTKTEAHITIHTMHSYTGEVFDRIYLYCPKGHEVGSSPVTTAVGARWAGGDFSGESCGVGSCSWSAVVA